MQIHAADIIQDREFWSWYLREYKDREWPELIARHGGTLVLELPCLSRSQFRLRLDFGINLRSLSLLVDGGSRELGWWDDARAHPHALRWAELRELDDLWRANGPSAACNAAAFALCAPFVGIGIGERPYLDAMRGLLLERIRDLPVFPRGVHADILAQTLRLPFEDDYEWRRDPRLGWTFSGDYPCYSLRNEVHSEPDGKEGSFPFEQWRSIFGASTPG
jgi:hypothetical protein